MHAENSLTQSTAPFPRASRTSGKQARGFAVLHTVARLEFLVASGPLTYQPIKVNSLGHISGLLPLALNQRQSHRKETKVNSVTALRH